MQQKILLAIFLASSAAAMPWGPPGGHWGPPSDSGSQDTESASAQVKVVTAMHQMTRSVVRTVTEVATDFDSPSMPQSIVPTATEVAIDSSSRSKPKSIVPTESEAMTDSGSPSMSTVPTATAAIPHSDSPSTTQKQVKQTSSATVAQPSASKSASPSSGASTGNAYSDMVVAHHNVHRANHSADPLKWDATLASTAEKIAKSCKFAHDTKMDASLYKNGYGQNIQAGASADNVWQAITESFYNGEVNSFAGNYGQANPSAGFEGWGHFSQMVWKSTTAVGCATVHCPNGVQDGVGTKDFTVCNYSPPGNYANDYAKNIGKSLNQPTVDKAQVSTSGTPSY